MSALSKKERRKERKRMMEAESISSLLDPPVRPSFRLSLHCLHNGAGALESGRVGRTARQPEERRGGERTAHWFTDQLGTTFYVVVSIRSAKYDINE